jgi:hypothetical protein
MIPETYEVISRHDKSVKLGVEGGRETSPIGRSQISSEEFAIALEESIKKSKVFRQVVKSGETDYILEVQILSVEQPNVGFDMEVKVAANWRILDMKSGKEVWQRIIITNFTAGMGDALGGVTRLRIANEGAAKKNIERGILEVSRLSL